MRHPKKSSKDKSNGYKHKHDKADRIKEEASVDNEEIEEEIESIKNLPEDEFSKMFEKMLVSCVQRRVKYFLVWFILPRAASRSSVFDRFRSTSEIICQESRNI